MVEDIAEEITETDLSKLKRLGIDEIALVKGQKKLLCGFSKFRYGKTNSYSREANTRRIDGNAYRVRKRGVRAN